MRTPSSDEYTPPVGFAREPREDRRRLVTRLLTFLLMAFIAWLALTRVISPPADTGPLPPPSDGVGSELPGPV